MKTPGFPIRFSKTPSQVYRGAPLAGEHTRDVLREAGISDARIDALLAERCDFCRAGQTVTRYRGLTWDHPRGYNALAAAAARLDEKRDGLAITWDKQPLEGFESHPIADLCARYDLVVLDHPHIGEAVAAGCLVPLEDIFDAGEIAAHRARNHWAMPFKLSLRREALGAAARRRNAGDGFRRGTPSAKNRRRPGMKSFACRRAARSRLPLQVRTQSCRSSPSRRASAKRRRRPIPTYLSPKRSGWRHSISSRRCMLGCRRRRASSIRSACSVPWPRAMQSPSVPLVYGYVNYASPSKPGTRPLAFGNAPRAIKDGRPGSTLGGTGHRRLPPLRGDPGPCRSSSLAYERGGRRRISSRDMTGSRAAAPPGTTPK